MDASKLNSIVKADASFTSVPGVVCGVLTADCLPVFVSKKDGSMVGSCTCWLARNDFWSNVENLIESFDCNGAELVVHLGPAISSNCFEVGEEIKDLYLSKNKNFKRSFCFNNNKYYLDLYKAAKIILEDFKVISISGGDRCTFLESEYYFLLPKRW